MKRFVVIALLLSALLTTNAQANTVLSPDRAEASWHAASEGAQFMFCSRRSSRAFNCWGREAWASASEAPVVGSGSFACVWRVKLTDHVAAWLMRCA